MSVLSISIVTYKTDIGLFRSLLEALNQSVSTLNAHHPGIIPALTILDNSTDNEELRAITSTLEKTWGFNTASIMQAEKNLGYGGGHNQCLQALNSTYHLVLNPDVLLQPDALAMAIEYMDNNPNTGLLTPHVSTPAGSQSFLCKRYPSVLDLFIRGFLPGRIRKLFRKRLDRYELRDVTLDKPVKGIPIASGCFMFFRSAVLKKLGGFAPQYFMYFEDYDLCMRLHGEAEIAYVPTVRIIHAGGDAAKKGLGHIRMFSVSAYRFFARWGWKWI